MDDQVIFSDPVLFSVWAHIEANQRLAAAKELAARMSWLHVAQWFQIVTEVSAERRRLEIYTHLSLREAKMKVLQIPAGFVADSGVIAEEGCTPETSDFCVIHSCFYSGECTICHGFYLP